MGKELKEYLSEVAVQFDELSTKYSREVALTLLNFAVNMRNTDNMNQNITANMNITEETKE